MTNTYNITGMKCGGCAEIVKTDLLKADGVTAVEIALADRKATITANSVIPATTLQQALSKGFTISE